MDVGDRASEHPALDGEAGGKVLDLEQRPRLIALRRDGPAGRALGVEGAHAFGRERAVHLAELRHGGEQHPRIVRAGVLEDVLHPALFDDLAAVHHDDAVGHLRDHRHVVGDEQHGHSVFALQPVDEGENLRLDRDVERGCRFVGDEQAGLARHGHGDDHALAHAPRELMGILPQAPLRLGDAHASQKLKRPRPRLIPPQAAMDFQSVGQLPLDGEHRIERGHRLLKDHADFVAAQRAHEFRRGVGEVDRRAAARGKLEASLRDASAAELDQPHEGERGHRLARAGLADDADGLAGIDRERHVIDGDHDSAVSLEFDPEVLDRDQRLRRLAVRPARDLRNLLHGRSPAPVNSFEDRRRRGEYRRTC